jgi:GNAT superfamily N-acetyltransferase
MTIEIKIIPKKNILTILPLLQQLNTKTPIMLLEKRVEEMVHQNYECIGMYFGSDLIGICGIWYMTRHYIGKSSELDHVVIDKSMQSKGYGKQFMTWVMTHLKSKSVESCELNAYIENPKSHVFYEREDFKKYGFHFVKILRKNNDFY